MKLISNTLFGDYLSSRKEEFKTILEYLEWYYELRSKYDKFLSQQLKLEMFVPCNEDGNVLEMPLQYNSFINLDEDMDDMLPLEVLKKCRQYQKAKERCLFEGFKYKMLYDDDIVMNDDLQINLKTFSINLFTDGGVFSTFSGNKIEYLVELGVTLTPTAIKQIGL